MINEQMIGRDVNMKGGMGKGNELIKMTIN
jgi:hypothetical protein